jgi:hypothetical protein
MISFRNDSSPNPQALFKEVLLGPLDWPKKTIRFEYSSTHVYRHRPFAASVSTSELYHENSKLYPEMLHTLSASHQNPIELRLEFIQRRSSAVRVTPARMLPLDSASRALLSYVGRACLPQFYAVELWVVLESMVAIHEPLSDLLPIVKQLSAADLESIRAALQLVTLTRPKTDKYLFLVASFARNEILFGQRGYRRTLLEAGQIAESVKSAAPTYGGKTWPIYDFVDHQLDRALELDGIEESIVGAFELKGVR